MKRNGKGYAEKIKVNFINEKTFINLAPTRQTITPEQIFNIKATASLKEISGKTTAKIAPNKAPKLTLK